MPMAGCLMPDACSRLVRSGSLERVELAPLTGGDVTGYFKEVPRGQAFTCPASTLYPIGPAPACSPAPAYASTINPKTLTQVDVGEIDGKISMVEWLEWNTSCKQERGGAHLSFFLSYLERNLKRDSRQPARGVLPLFTYLTRRLNPSARMGGFPKGTLVAAHGSDGEGMLAELHADSGGMVDWQAAQP